MQGPVQEERTGQEDDRETEPTGTEETRPLQEGQDDMVVQNTGDIVVPIADYARAISENKELASILRDDRRLTPDSMTRRELRAAIEQARDDLSAAVETMRKERDAVRKDVDAKDESELTRLERDNMDIHWALKSMLETADQRPELADANAVAVTAMLSTMSQRSGIPVKRLWNDYAPAIRKGEDGRILMPGDALWGDGRPLAQGQATDGGDALAQELGIRPESESEVRARYEGTDQWMKAPNGKPTNLTERQWVQVRTPEFKAWFGDWEAAANSDFLNGSPVGTIAEGVVPNFGKQSEIVEWASNFFASKINGGTIVMPVVGDVTLNRRSVKNSLSHGYGPAKIQSLALLPDVLPKSRLLDESRNKDGVQGYVFGAPVRIGEKDYVLISLVRKDANTKSVYVHECILRERIRQDIKTAASAEKDELTRSPAGTVRRIINKVFSVNPGNASKVVDKNGEPLVVYHGTRADDEFDVFRGGYFAGGKNGRETANAFATDPDLDKGGGRPRVYECFLNIRNPYDTGSNGGAYWDYLELTDEMVADGVPYDADKDFTGDDGVTYHYGTLNDIETTARYLGQITGKNNE